ncbi:PTS lactose/cellobiose transporter subunit IIA [Endozoicomonas ascidiicola]|uniref:PTS lactose/cellobiose transporter subunit IIA n=1 Tax=Endozoicomonas ascidiicola TaxID=1698521 RepID=UPI000829560D|nr:PTS lactose/cellobiose transporter subunit IIA [Endozoicomonas ascidiicola]
MDIEMAVMDLIVNSGQARSQAFEALAKARIGNFDKAEILMAQSRKVSKVAHQIQTGLIAKEGEGDLPINLLMVHAQDHLMTSMLAQDMAEEMIKLYQKLESLKEA